MCDKAHRLLKFLDENRNQVCRIRVKFFFFLKQSVIQTGELDGFTLK